MAYVAYQAPEGANRADFKKLSDLLDSMGRRYDLAVAELSRLYDEEASGDRRQVTAKADEICLDAMADLTLLFRYKIGNPGDYYAKMINGAIDYLRELRGMLGLLVSIERL